MRILMIAAENDAIRGAKVGGIGDVIRDVPPILADKGHNVAIVVPSYGFLREIVKGGGTTPVAYQFAGKNDTAFLYQVPSKSPHHHVTQYAIDHPNFASTDAHGRPEIYHPDPDERPFSTDASKYAHFCMAVAKAIMIGAFGTIDCIHLHDWHAAFFVMIREFLPEYSLLKSMRVVYTIHNLGIQGVRPYENDVSSLKKWFPAINFDPDKIGDPRWPECVNPAKAGIVLSDIVHVVSPSYASEIILPSDEPKFYGGAGLHECLAKAKNEDRLVGILNGCEYPDNRAAANLPFPELLTLLNKTVLSWASTQKGQLSPSHFIAHSRLLELRKTHPNPEILLTAISRITDQKTYLMKAQDSNHRSGLEGVIQALKDRGVCVMLGSGDPEYEAFLTQLSGRYSNFVFLNGYSDTVAQALYGSGDLFLMPSSFEPCGITQMLAMRDGQPCVVHGVGGLKDTVEHQVTGFVFNGISVKDQVKNFVNSTTQAIRIKLTESSRWRELCTSASNARFFWKDSIEEYINKLYQNW